MVPIMINFNINPDNEKINISIYPQNYNLSPINGLVFYSGDIKKQIDCVLAQAIEYIKSEILRDEDFRRNYGNYEFNKNIGAV